MNKFQNAKFDDFQIISTLAETHQSTTIIYLCRYQKQLVVCKVNVDVIEAILKESVVCNAKAVEHVKNQKQALKHFTTLKYDFICGFEGTFQDDHHLYIIMQMVEGLPFHKLLQMMGPLSLRVVKIMCSQIAQIMRLFHAQGYIYRDIKASNFMVNQKGKVVMIDLGKCKLIKKQRTYTVCGTSHAIPPDVYLNQGYSYQFDYYSFGVLVYELLVGKSPFGYGGSTKNLMNDVSNQLNDEILNKIKDPQAHGLIKQLIVRQPQKRFGYEGGFAEIMKHPFFGNEIVFGLEILRNESSLSRYDEDFSELISEIEDLGIEAEKYNEITTDDPFYKFL